MQISGNGDGRYAIVSFKKSEDARKANVASQDKRFFGANIRVSEHEGIGMLLIAWIWWKSKLLFSFGRLSKLLDFI